MDKQTLENIRQIIVNEYLNKKDEILEQEKSDKITSERANEQRTKLIGMMTAVEIIQREIKKVETEFEYRPFKYPMGSVIPNYGVVKHGVIISKYDYKYYVNSKNKKGKEIEIMLSESEIDKIIYEYNKGLGNDKKVVDEIL
jgi:hypothetical protein